MVGLNFCKGLALSAQNHLIPMHHLRGHIAALVPWTHSSWSRRFYASLPAAGSHIVRVQDYTHFEVLGRTVDDAAGEAFDKGGAHAGAGLSRRPGGSQAAQTGDSKAYPRPRPM